MFASPAPYKTHPGSTYDGQSVPTGSQVEVMERPNNKGGLVVTLRVWGLDPYRRYDAYVYTKKCGATPAAAGRRTQNGPSKEHYPQNEVWLNFKTNRRGDAGSQVWQYWTFNPGQANSVVIQPRATGGRVASSRCRSTDTFLVVLNCDRKPITLVDSTNNCPAKVPCCRTYPAVGGSLSAVDSKGPRNFSVSQPSLDELTGRA